MKLPLHLPSPPRPLVFVLLLGAVTSLVPLTLFLMHSTSYHKEPRIHLFQDMDNQVKHKAQGASALFADGRAMRPAVPGAVGRGQLGDDDHLNRGFELVEAAATEENPSGTTTHYLTGFPEEITVDELFVKHGQERYDAMCSLCHGLDGRGNGPVHQRAQQLMTSGRGLGTVWVPPASLMKLEGDKLAYGPELYSEGHLYNTIANGKGSMAGYAHAMPVEDRWAVVAYIRALQEAQRADVLAEAAEAEAAGEESDAAAEPDIPEAILNPPEPTVVANEGDPAVPGLGADSSTDASPSDNAEEDASAPDGVGEGIGAE
ncbi:c-type cytochrome [Phycisphaera mikurensis]|uniref:Cytochrome c family protein n=1 Tax=Phycisphaera mikurensis (strain NBRC 102666 / KCTC 22515 / FYK2301M01) TaxID=1142394 RepID=I0ICB9_PHYMF|nr:cytochrome c [Phycisphaera mikurensis]MBB6442216.1 mono/diheme cytochrome c family protein [Phycisphaera mikurensis]BAM02907.1 cytochrome c family protein [Phycisphaera mikurensis NBRC 102666]